MHYDQLDSFISHNKDLYMTGGHKAFQAVCARALINTLSLLLDA
jgi:hypothetical protein